MGLGQFLAFLAIVAGFVVGIWNVNFVFSPADWFLAAIAIILTLGVGPTVFHVRQKQAQ